MLKVDLHIHTVVTASDSKNFDFDLDVLKRYISAAKLDVIAITNHNCFDRRNYDLVKDALSIPVLPGIEINVSKPGSYGHVLVIADPNDLQEFEDGSDKIGQLRPDEKSHVPWDTVIGSFPSIKKWLVIPHYIKDKKMDPGTIRAIESSSGVDALEVSNAKKWLSNNAKTDKSLVVFSDCRPGLRMPKQDEANPNSYAYGYTYIQCSTPSISSLKLALRDKKNVSVFNRDSEFEILPEGIRASPRLNVLLGNRSSGKTHALKQILNAYSEEDCLYIEQFEITDEAREDSFNRMTREEDSEFFDAYFQPLKQAFTDYLSYDANTLIKECINYCEALIVYANSPSDSFSDCPIYQGALPSFEEKKLVFDKDWDLRKATLALSSSSDRRDVIAEYIEIERLAALNARLRELMRDTYFGLEHGKKANEIITAIRRELQKQTARKPLPSTDSIKQYFRLCYLEMRICKVLDRLNDAAELESEVVLKYRKTRTRRPIKTAKEARDSIKTKLPQNTDVRSLFVKNVTSESRLVTIQSFSKEVVPYICNLLYKIDSRLVTNDSEGSPLSGGQRAEYLLLHKLREARSRDIVLIDEPESSFDNPFLNTDVSEMLNNLADHSTVFLVTHNNTLGVSIHPDWILYTEKDTDGYRIYAGDFVSEQLVSIDGKTISRPKALLDSMEAGLDAYIDRSSYYEITGN